MTTPEDEVAYFDARAGLVGARQAVWDEPEERWTDGIAHCLRRLYVDRPRPRTVILDLGCGVGRLTEQVALLYAHHEVVGVDVSKGMVAIARAAPDRAPNAYYLKGDGRTLPAFVHDVGAAFSVLLFQHLPASAVAGYIEAVAGVLVPGGWFRFQWTVGTANADFCHDHDPTDVLTWCIKAGLEAEDVEEDDVYPTWRWLTARRP